MKETIYDLLNKYQITCNISEELTDTELGYLYLKMKLFGYPSLSHYQ